MRTSAFSPGTVVLSFLMLCAGSGLVKVGSFRELRLDFASFLDRWSFGVCACARVGESVKDQGPSSFYSTVCSAFVCVCVVWGVLTHSLGHARQALVPLS